MADQDSLKNALSANNYNQVLQILERNSRIVNDDIWIDPANNRRYYVDINNWSSFLGYAVKECSFEIIELLIKKGADLNYTDKYGQTPLMICNKPQVTKLLIEAGTNLEIKTPNGNTALMLFLVCDKPKSFKIALDGGADINTRDGSGRTPLMVAVEKCKKDAVDLLIEANADLSIKDNAGLTALDYARKHNSCIEALEAAPGIQRSIAEKKAAIAEAAARMQDIIGRVTQVEKLVAGDCEFLQSRQDEFIKKWEDQTLKEPERCSIIDLKGVCEAARDSGIDLEIIRGRLDSWFAEKTKEKNIDGKMLTSGLPGESEINDHFTGMSVEEIIESAKRSKVPPQETFVERLKENSEMPPSKRAWHQP